MDHSSSTVKLNKDFQSIRRRVSLKMKAQGEFVQNKYLDTKLLPMDRINCIIDSGESFIPLAELCGTYESQGHSGVFAGMGVIEGYASLIVASDYTQKGGMLTPMGVEKLLRVLSIAKKQRWPVVFFVESAGADLNDQLSVYARTGQIYSKMAQLIQEGVPILSIVSGSCTAGGAYIPGMSSYVIMVEASEVYLAGPPLVEAATGLRIDGQSLGGVDVHRQSGLLDETAKNDREAIDKARSWVKKQAYTQKVSFDGVSMKANLSSAVVYDFEDSINFEEMFLNLFDLGQYDLCYDEKGMDIILAQGSIGGQTYGVISNRGPFTTQGSLKTASFIQKCQNEKTPLVFLVNTPGFLVGESAERSGIIVAGSSLLRVIAGADVKKYVFVIGGSYGAGSYAMSHRSFDPDFIFSWPNSRLAVMGGRSVVKVFEKLYQRKGRKLPESLKKDMLNRYEKESHPLCTSSYLFDDGVIHPDHTRAMLIKLARFSQSKIKE